MEKYLTGKEIIEKYTKYLMDTDNNNLKTPAEINKSSLYELNELMLHGLPAETEDGKKVYNTDPVAPFKDPVRENPRKDIEKYHEISFTSIPENEEELASYSQIIGGFRFKKNDYLIAITKSIVRRAERFYALDEMRKNRAQVPEGPKDIDKKIIKYIETMTTDIDHSDLYCRYFKLYSQLTDLENKLKEVKKMSPITPQDWESKERLIEGLEKKIADKNKEIDILKKELNGEVTIQPTKENKLKDSQQDKIDVQKVAKAIWKENSNLSIKYMKIHPEIKKIVGRRYKDKTMHNWLSEVASNCAKKKGRWSEAYGKDQIKLCEKLSIKINS